MIPYGFPSDDVTIEIKVNDKQEFVVAPTMQVVQGLGTVRFKTDTKIGAQVHFPNSEAVFGDNGQGPDPLILELGVDDEKALSTVNGTTTVPYYVFPIIGGQIINGVNQAPIIIIVKTSRRTDE